MNLEKVLENHKEYLLSDGKKGKKANLRQADLRNADLSGADLRGANFRGADLRWADLRNANLRDANLRDADLRSANLRWANLRNADLRNANLRWADLSETDLRDAIGVVSTAKGCQLIAWKYKDEFWFNVRGISLPYEDAIKRWGSPEYPNKARGEAYCEAIKFLMETWPWDMEK